MNAKSTFGALIALLGAAASLPAQPQAGTQLWMFDAGETIESSPALAPDGTIYIGAGAYLYAITNGGSNKWTFPLGSGISISSPALGADGTVYIVSSGLGYLYAVNPDGSQKWTYAAAGGNGSPAIGYDGTVYVDGYSYLHAVLPSGLRKWRRVNGDGTRFASAALAPDGTIYIASRDAGILRGLNSDGAENWRFPVLHSFPGDSAAIGADGTVYFNGVGGNLSAFSPNGTNLWSLAAGDSNPSIGRDGTIYVATPYGSFPAPGYGFRLNAITPGGTMKWQFNSGNLNAFGVAAGTPAIDTAGIIYSTFFHSLYAVGPDGKLQWAFSTQDNNNDLSTYSYTSPTIGLDGTIYATFGSKLYAIAGTNKLADAPWPMYRQNARHTGKVEKPALKPPQKRSDANFQFQLYGQLGQTFTIESSTNLSFWTTLTSFVATNVPMDVVDLTASNFPARFYRAISP